jgi:hypothetical protein
MECTNEGRCSMICGPGDNDALFDDPLEDVVTTCSSSQDCAGIGIEYCTLSDGICLPVGSCTFNTDCTNNIDNNPFPIAMCIGTLECREGTCSQICDTDTGDVIDPIDAIPDATATAVVAEEAPTSTPCTTNNECDIDNEYCDEINGICLNMGQCNILDDCTNMNNIFAIVQCIGTLSCTDGQCSKICDGTSDEEEDDEEPTTTTTTTAPTSCRTNDECSNDGTEYCDAIVTGSCLKMGTCSSQPNCMDVHNMFAISSCVGTLSCIDGQCTQVCATTDSNSDGDSTSDEEEEMEEAPMSSNTNTTTCTTNIDCISYEGTDLVPLEGGGYERQIGSYCAQGVCMDMGSCNDNSDCSNPINLFDDKRCIGYLSCGGDDADDGTCTRICGTPCENGSQQQVECTVDPCKATCSDAVSCIVDLCDCTAVYYSSSGEVITDCDEYVDEATATANGSSSSSSSSNGEVYDSKEGGSAATATATTSSNGEIKTGTGTTMDSATASEVSGGSASSFYQNNNIIAVSASASTVVIMASSSLLLIISIL